jgi:hypothetical protein
MDRRFRVLRIIATIYKISAWVVLIVASLVALGTLGVTAIGTFFPGSDPNAPGIGPFILGTFGLGAVGIFLAGLLYFLFLYGIGEAIFLALAIEENTRESTMLLREVRQLSVAPPSAPLEPPPPLEPLPPPS